MVTAWADGAEACLRSAFFWEKPGLHIQQLGEERNILGSYRPNRLETEHEVTESASAARQDEHILKEKMKLGHKREKREKRRNHTYDSLAIPRLLGISDQVSGPGTDFTGTRMIPIFSSLLKKTQILQVLFQKPKEFLTLAVCHVSAWCSHTSGLYLPGEGNRCLSCPQWQQCSSQGKWHPPSLWEICKALGHPHLLNNFISRVRQALKQGPGLSVEVFIKCTFSYFKLNQNLPWSLSMWESSSDCSQEHHRVVDFSLPGEMHSAWECSHFSAAMRGYYIYGFSAVSSFIV